VAGRFAVVLTVAPAACVAVGGTKAKEVGEGTGEALVFRLVIFRLVMLCSWLESRLKLGVGESVLELELEERCFRVELARETEADGGREDLEDLERTEGAWETRREMAGEAGAGRVEEGVSSGLVLPLLVEREK
jgi:hypothetical protein